ncbi:MAG: mechanosensitive ion channel family protein [Ferruginibacter sp.]
MDFLDNVYFGNTIKSYLLVIAIIIFIVLFKRFVSRFAAALFYGRIKKVWTTVKKQDFMDLVVGPIDNFLVVVVTIFAVDKLYFPEELKFNIYGHSIQDILNRLAAAAIVITFTLLVLRLVDFIALILEGKANETVDTRDNQLIVFFRDFLKVIVGVCGVLLIIKACFHQPIGSVLTGLSIVGAALALAAKESLENLIASFIIFFDKPFFTGDTVKVNAVNGTVERIGLRSTRIRTPDKTLVTVPNKQMVDSVVDNWSMRTERKADIKLELSAGTSSATLEKLLTGVKTIIAAHGESIHSSSVFIKELSKNSAAISVEYFTAPVSINDFFQQKEQINLAIKKLLEENHVEFAGESSSIIIKSEQNTEG